MSAEEFIAAARRMRGVRWRHQGRKPWAVDCLGLVYLAAREAGLNAPDVRGYGREPWDDKLRAGLRELFGEPVDDPRPGDIALIRWGKAEPSHVAILADHPNGGLSMIHAHNIEGVVEHAVAGDFKESIIEVYRPWRDTSSQ